MKQLDKLIKSLNKKAEMHKHLSEVNKSEGMNDTAFYNEGIAEGIWKAIEEIEEANTSINIQINNL